MWHLLTWYNKGIALWFGLGFITWLLCVMFEPYIDALILWGSKQGWTVFDAERDKEAHDQQSAYQRYIAPMPMMILGWPALWSIVIFLCIKRWQSPEASQ